MICLICKENLKNFTTNIDDFSNQKFKIYNCKNCRYKKTLFHYNIDKYYHQNYYGLKNIKFKFIFEKISIFLRILRIIKLLFFYKKNKKILDIGFGRGIELKYLQKKYDTYGVEVKSRLLPELKNYGIKFLSENLILKKRKKNYFDYVMLWHNLEHQKNLNQIISGINYVMKKDGHLILEVPNSESLQAKFAGNKWIYWDTPRHLHHFSIKSLKILLNRHGLKITKVKTFSIEYGPFGMLNTILNFFYRRKNLLYRFLLNNKLEKLNGYQIIKLFILSLTILPFATICELIFSYYFNNGSIIKITAKKI